MLKSICTLLSILLVTGSMVFAQEHEPQSEPATSEVETHSEEKAGESQDSHHQTSDHSHDSHGSHDHDHGHEAHLDYHPKGSYHLDGKSVHLLWCIPFVGILLSIALLPLFASHFWHHHYGKVSLSWGLAFLIPFAIWGNGHYSLSTAFFYIFEVYILEFIPFIVLLMSLFAVTGGIALTGTLRGSPKVNTALLGIGVLIASWMGTTGAAMLLIRPVMKANAWREKKVHVIVFFIFLVANIGGSLTPLGDPPLFLGFLKGVSFFWTTTALLIPYLITSIILLVIFFAVDTFFYKKETAPPDDGEKQPLALKGKVNFFLLGGVIGAVVLSGVWKAKTETAIPHTEFAANLKSEIEASGFKFKEVEGQTVIASRLNDETIALLNSSGHKVVDKEASFLVHGKLEKSIEEKLEATKVRYVDRGDSYEVWIGLPYEVQESISKAGYNLKSGKGEDKILKKLPENVMVDLTNLGFAVQMSYGQGVMIILLVLITVITMKITPTEIRELNGFNWEPILEVAKLFATIFITMVPAIAILKAGVDGSLRPVIESVFNEQGPVNEMFFWATGILSSFLDNAPTYVVFFETASGDAIKLMDDMKDTLTAISMGAVFMGANTYIGNAPNFMVKSIAEEGGIKMPSFFGYMAWSLAFLVPTFMFLTIIKAWHFHL